MDCSLGLSEGNRIKAELGTGVCVSVRVGGTWVVVLVEALGLVCSGIWGGISV